ESLALQRSPPYAVTIHPCSTDTLGRYPTAFSRACLAERLVSPLSRNDHHDGFYRGSTREEFGLAGDVCDLSRKSGTSAGRSPCERSPTTRAQGDMVETHPWWRLRVSRPGDCTLIDGKASEDRGRRRWGHRDSACPSREPTASGMTIVRMRRSVPMPPVILTNPFEVPEGKDEAFLAEWEAAKAFMERQPGYLSTRLHRSRAPNTRFRFINVAEWGNRRGLSSCPQPPRI